MSEYVYLIYDTREDPYDHKNVSLVAIVDNDEDFLRFLMLHPDEYPLRKDCCVTYEDLWKDEVDVLEAQDFFKNIFVDKVHINVDYGMKLGLYGKEIDYLAKEKGIKLPEVA